MDLERNIVYGTKADQTFLNLADFKTHARIYTDAEDLQLTAKLQGAADHLEKMTRTCLVETQVDIYLNRFPKGTGRSGPRAIQLGVSPVISIDKVEYEQQLTGQMVELVEGTGYYQSLYGNSPYICEVMTSDSVSGCWPDYDINWYKPNVIHIAATCGIADQTTVEKQITFAGYMLLTLWYQNREGSNPNIEYKDLPGYASVVGMLAPYTKVSF